ncbi:uncharacterized protein [Primulina huaijiensis]|uniref:uncharacterized protein n=1 Tax=Primulina huaijiensis TaxID=1492673 RepID=UPI003CC755FA
MKRNQESMFAEGQATRQEREENAEGYQSMVEETQSLRGGENLEMEEMWNEIRMLRQQLGSRAPAPKRRSLFSLAILEEGLPPNFRQSNVGEYDRHTDPEEHLGRFENAALLHQYANGVRCRVFLGTLQEAENLREFFQRFNSVALKISAATPDIMISAFTQGLKGGECFKSLVKKPPSSYDDLLARAEKYVSLEDAQRYRRMENRSGGSRVEGTERRGRKRGAGEMEEDKDRGRGQFSSHVPLDRSRDKMMEVREPEERWENSQRVESGARLPSRDRQERSSSGSRPRSRPSPTRGQGPPWINQRVGEQRGEGRDSGRAWKAHGRRLENFEISRGADLPQDPVISFGPEDLRGIVAPHNDALVVTATIANYDVARIFIDNGSSVNVLFKSTLDQMKVEGFEFEPVSTPLYGFAGHAIPPLGQIVLPLSLGTDPRRVTKMIAFTVVDNPSAYNGILGRPALKDFRAVASTYHQKLKFPVGKGVGVLCGDQKVARQCYEGVVREEGKRARGEVQEDQRGKLDPEWEGLFRVIDKFNSGAHYLENAQGKALKRPWNAYHLREYHSGFYR